MINLLVSDTAIFDYYKIMCFLIVNYLISCRSLFDYGL